MKAARDTWLNPALAIAACVAAGALFYLARLPLPWMLGPLLAMALANFGGAELRAPPGGRYAGQVVIGAALGLYFTPAVAHQVVTFWPILLAGAAFAIALGVCGGWMLSRTAQTDSVTAYFASVPGGATEMTLLGERFGARPDRVALAQSLRIVAVVVLVPFALTYSGVHGTDSYVPAAIPLHLGGLAALLAAALLAGWALHRAGFANAFMFGPLAVSAALTVNEVEFSSMPSVLSIGAQVALGCALGARFEQGALRSAPRYVVGVLASVLLALVAAVFFAVGLAWLSGMPWPSMVLAMAPGGLAEMCITAKVLELGVPLVTAAHVVRIAVLIASTGPGFRLVQSWRGRF